MFRSFKSVVPDAANALPGRANAVDISAVHAVTGRSMVPPFPDGVETVILGMGCFWGSEELYWPLRGVWVTAVGYAGGTTPNATYEEVCSGRTGHTEVVLVAFDPAEVDFDVIMRVFWENHDPTQGMRQGNDIGTQYRSAIFTTTDAQAAAAAHSRDRYQQALTAAGRGEITTEISAAGPFYYAEEYHQQYLSPAKNPHGYRCHSASGVGYPRS